MNSESSVDADVATAAMRAQWDQMAQGWSNSGAVIRPWLHKATQAMLGMAGVEPVPMCSMWPPVPAIRPSTSLAGRSPGPRAGHRSLAEDPSIRSTAGRRRGVPQRRGTRFGRTGIADRGLKLRRGGLSARTDVFGDPLQGLREMARVLKPGGGVCTMVFGAPQANPCVTTLMSTALRHAGMPPRDPFQPGGLLGLGEPGLIDESFEDAGIPRDRGRRGLRRRSTSDGQGLHEIRPDVGRPGRADIEEPGRSESRSRVV